MPIFPFYQWRKLLPAAKEPALQTSSLCNFFSCFSFSQLKSGEGQHYLFCLFHDYCKNYMIYSLGKITLKIKKRRGGGAGGEEKEKENKNRSLCYCVVQSVSTVCHNSSARMVSPWSKSLCRMK